LLHCMQPQTRQVVFESAAWRCMCLCLECELQQIVMRHSTNVAGERQWLGPKVRTTVFSLGTFKYCDTRASCACKPACCYHAGAAIDHDLICPKGLRVVLNPINPTSCCCRAICTRPRFVMISHPIQRLIGVAVIHVSGELA